MYVNFWRYLQPLLLEDLQSRNERMFLVTVLVMNTAKKRQKLDNNIFQVQGIAQKDHH